MRSPVNKSQRRDVGVGEDRGHTERRHPKAIFSRWSEALSDTTPVRAMICKGTDEIEEKLETLKIQEES